MLIFYKHIVARALGIALDERYFVAWQKRG